ncbi:MAG: shikimate kinase [Oscillospiraceae bacterium]|nr:shikimate kinase [Oscillospiraceae bacterium]
MKNIILIGMPGCGKSTVGVILAKTLGMGFVDTDLMIQQQRQNTLQKLIDDYGLDRFREFEEQALLSVPEKSDTVIATGGSAVFCPEGMAALKENGVCLYLDLPLEELERRLTNITTRGIACRKGESLGDILAEREPLYRKYADITVECEGLTTEQTVEAIISSF